MEWRAAARAALCLLACMACGHGTTTDRQQQDIPGVDPSKIGLQYVCDEQFRALNFAAHPVSVGWKVENSGDQGSLDLPAAPSANAHSETLFTTRAIGTVVLTANGATLASAPNQQNPCTTQTKPLVQVKVTPQSTTLTTGTNQQFAAQVIGSENVTVAWSVQEGASAGTVDDWGYYTAPATPGTYHVVATSRA